MAYVEVWKNGKLVDRRTVDAAKARQGFVYRLGPGKEVRLRAGESAEVGELKVRLVADKPREPKQGEGRRGKTGDQALPAAPSASGASPAGNLPDGPSSAETRDDGLGSSMPLEPSPGIEARTLPLASRRRPGQRDAGAQGRQEPSEAATRPQGPPPEGAPDIEGFRIVSWLGEGAMGAVWRAVQLSTGREVALKLLGSHLLGSDKARRRFEREVELAARLNHPNVARVFDSGLHRGGYYCAMELIDGVHLDKYVRENKSSRREILELMGIVCEAVQHAHQRGVIHRDLKPANILVTPEGQPYVVDFGLALRLQDQATDRTFSRQGEFIGTLEYAAPEQAAGRIDELDTRTDTYSLGKILYRLLTGKSAHELTGNLWESRRVVAEEKVRLPSEVKEGLDRDLEAILLKALDREPDSRYSSAAELADDIRRFLHGETIRARVPSFVDLLRRAVRRYPVALGMVVLSLIVLIDMVVMAYIRTNDERRQRLELRERLHAAQRRVAGLTERLRDSRAALADAMLWKWESLRLRLLAERGNGTAQGDLAFRVGPGKIRSVAFAEDRNVVVLGTEDGQLDAWYADKGERKSRSTCPGGRLMAISRGDGLPRVVLADAEGLVLRGLGKEVSERRLGGPSSPVVAALSPDGAWVVSADREGAIVAQPVSGQAGNAVSLEAGSPLLSVAVAPDGQWVAFARKGSGIGFRPRQDERSDVRKCGGGEQINALAFSPVEARLIAGGADGTISVWDLKSAGRLVRWRAHRKAVAALAFSQGGDRIVSAGQDGQIKIWDIVRRPDRKPQTP